MRQKNGVGRLYAAAVALATAASLLWVLPGCGAALAAGVGGLLGGPLQALHAAESLAGDESNALPASTAPATVAPLPSASPAPSTAAPRQTAVPAAAEAPSVSLSQENPPAGAGTITEKTYTQSPGGIYVACGAGTVRNNTSEPAQTVADAVAAGMPFSMPPSTTAPQVLILHTHATECYRTHSGLWFAPGDTARSTDTDVDMCAVGRVMADVLNAAGICTLHDETLNDYPSYTGSYANSRAVATRYLQQYPSIRVILDVHRDAIESGGARIAPVCSINGRQAAQVMLICGCNHGSSVVLPNCHENLRFAAAWEARMEEMYPGFTRPVLYSYRFYNQDLLPGCLLIEVGGHGNTLDEAEYGGYLAANALAALLKA